MQRAVECIPEISTDVFSFFVVFLHYAEQMIDSLTHPENNELICCWITVGCSPVSQWLIIVFKQKQKSGNFFLLNYHLIKVNLVQYQQLIFSS